MARSDQQRDGRYTQGAVTVDSFPNRIGWWERRVFPSDTSDVPITISSVYAGRPDLMAFDAYGKATLAWVILQYNNIVDINLEFVTGATIKLPLPQRINTDFLTQPVTFRVIQPGSTI